MLYSFSWFENNKQISAIIFFYFIFFLEQSKTDPAEFQSNGITAEGVKYTFLRAQDNMILGKIKLMASYDSLVMINYKNC